MQEKESLVYLLILHNIWITQKFLNIIFKEKENYREFYESISYNLLETYWFRKNNIEKVLTQKKNYK